MDDIERIEEIFTTPKNPNAQRDRNVRARQLRKEGWTVKCKSYNFGGLGYGQSFILRATKNKEIKQ